MVSSRTAVRVALFLALCLGLAPLSARAFEGERPGYPVNDERVGAWFEFWIEADGRPATEEFYRIEVARDSDFEQVVAVFDQRKQKQGWLIGDPLGLDDIPEQYRPQNYEGIHYKVRGRLRDGEYWWRAYKALGGGDWTLLDGEGHFFVDTDPPAPVDSLEVTKLEDGSIELRWAPVVMEVDEEPEDTAGYRVYRYTRRLKRYPLMTRYLVAETEDTRLVLPPDEDENLKIVFYRVNAVDQAGNEMGRRRPKPLGAFDVKFHPPDADSLTNPEYLRQLSQEGE